jgi:hypothetical protein
MAATTRPPSARPVSAAQSAGKIEFFVEVSQLPKHLWSAAVARPGTASRLAAQAAAVGGLLHFGSPVCTVTNLRLILAKYHSVAMPLISS